jgi:hypothetical protein
MNKEIRSGDNIFALNIKVNEFHLLTAYHFCGAISHLKTLAASRTLNRRTGSD